jgi:hypothetical protein
MSRFGGVFVTYSGGFHWMIGFIDTLYTQLVTTINSHTLQFTVTHTQECTLSTSRILATGS